MDGYLLINKPAGISSFGVVSQVRRLISQATGKKTKVGHTGTLDPAATGLLILVIGSYCKRADEFSRLDKTYWAEITLGAVSTTGDSEGEIVLKNSRKPGRDEITTALNKFIGVINQVPPAFSAIKVDGNRAYKLARKGQEVILQPRAVTIFDIRNIIYSYPQLSFTVRVSSGTYIRSLAVDIGEELGTGAYLSALERTQIADFKLKDAVLLDGLELKDIKTNLKS